MRRPDVKRSLCRKPDSGKASPMDEARPNATREDRLAAKLRENLRRRKTQARAIGRREEPADDGLPKPPARG